MSSFCLQGGSMVIVLLVVCSNCKMVLASNEVKLCPELISDGVKEQKDCSLFGLYAKIPYLNLSINCKTGEFTFQHTGHQPANLSTMLVDLQVDYNISNATTGDLVNSGVLIRDGLNTKKLTVPNFEVGSGYTFGACMAFNQYGCWLLNEQRVTCNIDLDQPLSSSVTVDSSGFSSPSTNIITSSSRKAESSSIFVVSSSKSFATGKHSVAFHSTLPLLTTSSSASVTLDSSMFNFPGTNIITSSSRKAESSSIFVVSSSKSFSITGKYSVTFHSTLPFLTTSSSVSRMTTSSRTSSGVLEGNSSTIIVITLIVFTLALVLLLFGCLTIVWIRRRYIRTRRLKRVEDLETEMKYAFQVNDSLSKAESIATIYEAVDFSGILIPATTMPCISINQSVKEASMLKSMEIMKHSQKNVLIFDQTEVPHPPTNIKSFNFQKTSESSYNTTSTDEGYVETTHSIGDDDIFSEDSSNLNRSVNLCNEDNDDTFSHGSARSSVSLDNPSEILDDTLSSLGTVEPSSMPCYISAPNQHPLQQTEQQQCKNLNSMVTDEYMPSSSEETSYNSIDTTKSVAVDESHRFSAWDICTQEYDKISVTNTQVDVSDSYLITICNQQNQCTDAKQIHEEKSGSLCNDPFDDHDLFICDEFNMLSMTTTPLDSFTTELKLSESCLHSEQDKINKLQNVTEGVISCTDGYVSAGMEERNETVYNTKNICSGSLDDFSICNELDMPMQSKESIYKTRSSTDINDYVDANPLASPNAKTSHSLQHYISVEQLSSSPGHSASNGYISTNENTSINSQLNTTTTSLPYLKDTISHNADISTQNLTSCEFLSTNTNSLSHSLTEVYDCRSAGCANDYISSTSHYFPQECHSIPQANSLDVSLFTDYMSRETTASTDECQRLDSEPCSKTNTCETSGASASRSACNESDGYIQFKNYDSHVHEQPCTVYTTEAANTYKQKTHSTNTADGNHFTLSINTDGYICT